MSRLTRPSPARPTWRLTLPRSRNSAPATGASSRLAGAEALRRAGRFGVGVRFAVARGFAAVLDFAVRLRAAARTRLVRFTAVFLLIRFAMRVFIHQRVIHK